MPMFFFAPRITVRHVLLVGSVGISACTGAGDSAQDTDTTTGIKCGDSEYYDVTVLAKVEDASGAAVAGVEVSLEERNLQRTFGSGTSDASGNVELLASQVESIPECWGLLLNYWLVASCDGSECAEDDMNTELYNAIDGGTLVADVTAFPLVVE